MDAFTQLVRTTFPAAETAIAVAGSRRGFIGGSDIAAIIGLSPWKDPYRLYLEKRGEIDQPEAETKVQRRGRILEPAIRQLYAEEHGADVRDGATLHLPDMPWARAQIDATELVDDLTIPVEIKSASEFTRGKWGASGTDDAPTYYCSQLHWQMAAMGAPFGRIVALLGADDLRVYTIERDPSVDQFLAAKAAEFWNRVLTGEEPTIDFDHASAGETLELLFKNFNATEILQADNVLRSWRDVMVDAGEQIKSYEGVRDGAKAHLLSAMRTAAIIDFGDGQIYERKTVKRKGYAVADCTYVSGRLKKASASTKADARAPALLEE